ncbi:hypothetical protein Lser_V15G39135 [Lactuca serriola]
MWSLSDITTHLRLCRSLPLGNNENVDSIQRERTEVISWPILKIPKPSSDAIEMRESLSKCNNIHVYLYSCLNLARDVSGESSDLISKTWWFLYRMV